MAPGLAAVGPGAFFVQEVKGLGGLVENALGHVIESVLGACFTWLGHVAVWIGDLGVLQTQLPWVHTAQTTLMALAATVLGVYVAYLALTRWILWNEGTADFDGTVLFKAILRTTLYFGLSGSLVVLVYRFGLDLGWVIMGTSFTAGTHTLQGFLATIEGGTGNAGMLLLGVLALALAVILLAVIFIETIERAAELVVYLLAAPFVALGQLNPDGGTWSSWWRNLVILSLSQAVQLLCLRGLAGTSQLILLLHGSGGTAYSLGTGQVGTELALLFSIGWLIVGIRGPHVLKEWSYRSGFAGMAGWAGSQTGGNAVRSATSGSGK